MPIILELLIRFILGIFYILAEILFEQVISFTTKYLYQKIKKGFTMFKIRLNSL